MRVRGVIGLAGLGLLWGSEWILGPEVRWLPPLEVAALRCLFAAVVLAPALARAGKPILAWPVFRANLMLVLLLVVGPSLLVTWGARSASSGSVAVSFGMVPLWTALLEGSLARWLSATVLGVGGVALISANALPASAREIPGVLCLVLAAGCIAWGTMRATEQMKASGELRSISPAACVSMQMLMASAVLGALSAVGPQEKAAGWTLPAVGAVVALGTFGTAGGYVLFFTLLRRLAPVQGGAVQTGAVQIGAVQWLTVMAAVGESALIFRQRPGLEMVAGAAVVLAAIGLLLRAEPEESLTLRVTEVDAGR